MGAHLFQLVRKIRFDNNGGKCVAVTITEVLGS